jgi:hypothetical protein
MPAGPRMGLGSPNGRTVTLRMQRGSCGRSNTRERAH